MRALGDLLASTDVDALQEVHGQDADLVELMNICPGCLGTGTFSASQNAGGTAVLLHRSFLVAATSLVSQPTKIGRSMRVMVDRPSGSLNIVAIHSDPAQAVGLRRNWLRHALGTRGESPRTLTIAVGD